jgi:hypothetical protein
MCGGGNFRNGLVYTFYEIVTALIQFINVALCSCDHMVIFKPGFVFLVPQLYVGLRKLRNQSPNTIIHARLSPLIRSTNRGKLPVPEKITSRYPLCR